MTGELIIHAPGIPIAWMRAGRQIRSKAGQAFVQTYTPGKVQQWEDRIADFAQKAAAASGWQKPDRGVPLCIDFDFHLPRGSARKRDVWKVSKPDKDNLEKAGLDALVWSGVIACDQQAVDGRTRKLIDDDWQGVIIRIALAESPGLPIGHKSKPMPIAQEALAI